MTTIVAKIQRRRGAAAAWTSNNPTLLAGEEGHESDTGKYKVGDGTTAWTSLAYFFDPGDFATAAQGVTNGDTHDHVGGDGAQIAYSGLSGLPTLGTAAATDSTDYATAAQGSTANSAVQPGDDADTLGSGVATTGQVLTADGIGGAAWEAAAAAGGDVTGPASSTDNALARFHETGGKTLQDSTATLSDAGALTLNNGTLTASAPVLDVSQTWNDAAVAFTGVKANITDTASAATSKLLDLQVGGISRFVVEKSGRLLIRAVAQAGVTLYSPSSNVLAIQAGSSEYYRFNTSFGFQQRSANYLGWSSADSTTAADLTLYRDAADTLAQRRTTNAQTFRLYNSWTNADNYERLAFTWTTNLAEIKTEAAGTGTLRDLSIGSSGGKLAFLGATPVARPAHVADADTAHALNATFSDTEVEAALNLLGTKLNSVLAALRAFGLLSTS